MGQRRICQGHTFFMVVYGLGVTGQDITGITTQRFLMYFVKGKDFVIATY